jgi:hypothetical protein
LPKTVATIGATDILSAVGYVNDEVNPGNFLERRQARRIAFLNDGLQHPIGQTNPIVSGEISNGRTPITG